MQKKGLGVLMNDTSEGQIKKLSRAQEIFKTAKPEYQELIRDILKVERDVMHLKRRPEVHQRIYEHVRRVIK
jgi:hypothetical protein